MSNNNLSSYIGVTIRRRRKKRGITQKELAEKLGTKQPSIARIESGQILPSLVFLNKIANYLDTDIRIIIKPKVL